MSETFRCEDAGRRRALLEQTGGPGARIDAIDYVIVVDGIDVPATLRQRVLLVRMVFGDSMAVLDPSVLRIEGGVRVREIDIAWAMAMRQVVGPGGPAVDPVQEPDSAARAWLAARVAATPDAAQWLVVRLDGQGDHSRYELRLVGSAGGPLAGFDRRLSVVPFSFKVECPTTLDCRDDASCPPVHAPQPEIDYLARDYASMRRLMFERLALLQPDENDDRQPAALRTILVEALAYAADRLAAQQDAVGTEAHLSTARLRRSVRRHAKLLDYPMHEGCNARAFVHLRIVASMSAGAPAAPAVPVGARFWTRVAELVDPATLSPAPWVPPAMVRTTTAPRLAFEAMLPLAIVSAAHNEIALHAWGDADCCLPAGTTGATLVIPAGGLVLSPEEFLVLEEVAVANPMPSDARDPDPTRRHVVRLVEVSAPYTDELLGVDVLDVRWDVDDALPFALPVAGLDNVTTVARGNLVLVDHGARVQDAPVLVEAFGHEGRRGALQRPGLTWSDPLPATPISAAAIMRPQPERATAQVVLIDADDERWSVRRDLLGSDSRAHDFTVEMESDGRAHLRFGDDRLGRAPGLGSPFVARYRVGTGDEGNVGAEAIVHAVADPDDPAAFPTSTAAVIEAVRNPLPGLGGCAPESIAEVKRYAPHAFTRQQRAVTVEDWSEVAERDAEIQRAVATLRWTGAWTTVFLHVDRVGGAPVDAQFRARQFERLSSYRLAGYDLEIVPPRHVPVDLAATVCVAPGFLRADVERRVRREFTLGLTSDGRRGFFHPDEFTFGQPLHLSRLVARIMAVTGVRSVDFSPPSPVAAIGKVHRFARWGRPQTNEFTQGRIDVGRFEIIRCDDDPNYFDHGRIAFFMEGGV